MHSRIKDDIRAREETTQSTIQETELRFESLEEKVLHIRSRLASLAESLEKQHSLCEDLKLGQAKQIEHLGLSEGADNLPEKVAMVSSQLHELRDLIVPLNIPKLVSTLQKDLSKTISSLKLSELLDESSLQKSLRETRQKWNYDLRAIKHIQKDYNLVKNTLDARSVEKSLSSLQATAEDTIQRALDKILPELKAVLARDRSRGSDAWQDNTAQAAETPAQTTPLQHRDRAASQSPDLSRAPAAQNIRVAPASANALTRRGRTQQMPRS